MIKFEQVFKAKDLNNEDYSGKIIGYSNKVLLYCKDSKKNIFQNLILFSDLKSITSFKLCKSLSEIKNKFYQLFKENVKVENKNSYLRLYLDIPNEEITKIVSKVLTLSRDFTEEEKEEIFDKSPNKNKEKASDYCGKKNNKQDEESKVERYYEFNEKQKIYENKQKYHSSCIHSMLILKDGRLISSSWDGTIKIYNKNNYYVDMTINAHKGHINQIVSLEDGNFASCSEDKTIKIWKIEDNKYTEVQTILGHEDTIYNILQMSKELLLTGSESVIKFWKKENEKWVNDENYKEIKVESQVADTLKINDNEILCYCKNSFDFYHIEKGKEPIKLINISTSCSWPFSNLMINLNENIAIAGGNSGNSALQMIDIKNRKKIKDINYSNQITSIVKVSNSIFFAGDNQGNIIRFDYNSSNNNITDNVIGKVHQNSINCIILDLKGKIISGSEDHNIKIWDSLTMIPLDLLNPEIFETVKKEVVIKEENIKKSNEKIRENLINKDLFLCPKCLKNIPLFFSFDIDDKKDIYLNYDCYCNDKNNIQSIKLSELINIWKNKTFNIGKCNSHSTEGKFCPKCKKWLCPECIKVHNDIKGSHANLLSKIEILFNKNCNIHNKKCNGFCNTCYNEICSACAGYFNDGHKKYTHEDQSANIFENLEFQCVSEFKKMVNKMKNRILNYKNQQIEKLDKIIDAINKLRDEINQEYEIIERNNNYLTTYYLNLFNTYFNYRDAPSYNLNENVSKFQFNKKFLIIESENNDKYEEISLKTLETFKTCNLYQIKYYIESNKDEPIFELNINNNKDDSICSIIQLKDKTIAAGLYNSKKIVFYDYTFKKLTDNNITTKGNITSLCEVNNNRIAVATYNPYNIVIYDISQKDNGVFKELAILEGHQNRINSVIELNNNYLISGEDDSSYEIFSWDSENYKLQQKLKGHESNVNFIIKLKRDNYFASCGQDAKIIIWNNLSQFITFNFSYPIRRICNLETDKIVAVDSVRKIHVIYNYSKGGSINQFSSIHSSEIISVLSLDDNRIVTADSEKLISIYEPENLNNKYYKFSYCMHNKSPINVLYQTQNFHLLTGDSKGFLNSWSPQYNNNLNNNEEEEENKVEIFKDSSIVQENERQMILDWISPINSNKSFKSILLYRASNNGDNPQSFHSNCDNKGPTITFLKHCSTGYRLGGYTNYSWQSEGDFIYDPNSFLFSLNNRKKFNKKNSNNNIFLNKEYGPYFNKGIYFNSNGNWLSKNNVYCYNSSCYDGTIKDLIGEDTTSSSKAFRISDMEVFLLKY